MKKSGGPERSEGSFCAFRSFLSQLDLFDIKHSGNYLSWRGKRGTHVVQCRLDRSMCNSDWAELFPFCRSQYLNFEGSDHHPLLSFLDTKKKTGKRIFRYDRRLRDNTEVQAIIKEVWETFTHLCVEARLNLCRRAICKWSKEYQMNSRKAIENLREELEEAMVNPISDDAHLHDINAKLLKAYKAEEEYWR